MDINKRAEKVLKEFLKVSGVIVAHVEVLHPVEKPFETPSTEKRFTGGTNRDDEDLNLMLTDATRSACAMCKVFDQPISVRLGDYRIIAEPWPSMIVAVAIPVGHPSTKSLARKFRRVANKLDPDVQSPGASASAATPARPPSSTLH